MIRSAHLAAVVLAMLGCAGLCVPCAAGASWPISGGAGANADTISLPYGPRWIGRYDFHAGIDIPAAQGTPVRSVLPGTVIAVRTWDGVSTGAGNNVLVQHADGKFTAYLHLHTMNVAVNDVLAQGQQLGTVGKTGASSNHLHLTYMVGLTGTSNDERKSRNPLEILPHTAPASLAPAQVLEPHKVRLTVPLQSMTIRTITLAGQGQERMIDYYSIVTQGSTARDEQLQSGIYIEVASPQSGSFPLTLTLDPASFAIENVRVTDFNGQELLNQTVAIPEPVGALVAILVAPLLLSRRRSTARKA